MDDANKESVLGKITSVYGVKGWVKVFSYTQPKENIFNYPSWKLKMPDGSFKQVKLASGKEHGNGLIAQLEGCDDREIAKAYSNCMIMVATEQLPSLEPGDYYWHQLEGLQVVTVDQQLLGKVDHLIETGSNDVMVVRKCKGSIDGRERLVPYLPEQYVKKVDLERGCIEVDWDPEF